MLAKYQQREPGPKSLKVKSAKEPTTTCPLNEHASYEFVALHFRCNHSSSYSLIAPSANEEGKLSLSWLTVFIFIKLLTINFHSTKNICWNKNGQISFDNQKRISDHSCHRELVKPAHSQLLTVNQRWFADSNCLRSHPDKKSAAATIMEHMKKKLIGAFDVAITCKKI